jgi:UDP-glucose 4-epimerase
LRDWTDVRDVVSGLEKVAQLASTDAPVLNLASGMATAVRDMAATVGAVWASSESTVLVTFSGNSRPGDPFSLVADIAQLRTYGIELGGSLAQGVEDYVAWYRTHMKVAG